MKFLFVLSVVVLAANYVESQRITCKPDEILKRTEKKICVCKPPQPPQPSGSLIFVLDSTNSMKPTIDAVKEGITGLAKANKIFKNFVVSSFNDPYEKTVKKTTNANEIVEFLEELFVFGGGDCPEPSITASIDALEAADKHSMMVIFTDASAKDAQKRDLLIKKLKLKRTSAYYVITGDLCFKDKSSNLKYKHEYEKIAARTFGRINRMKDQTHIKKIMQLLTKIVAGEISANAFPDNTKQLIDTLKGKCICRYDYICVPRPTKPPTTPAPTKPAEPTKKACKDHEYPFADKQCKCKKPSPPAPRPPKTHKHDGSLIFVIDTTNSMDNTINQVKNSIRNIVAKNKKFKNYVAVAYNDYSEDVSLRNIMRVDKFKSTDADAIFEFLDEIFAHGGGDCPEPAMTGMLAGIRLAEKNSVLFLFTDASAKDYKYEPKVREEMKAKNVEPYVVLVGNVCQNKEDGGFKYHNEYETLTSNLGGKVVKFTNDKSIKKVMDFIEKSASNEADFHDINEVVKPQKPICVCVIVWICKSKCPAGAHPVQVIDQGKTSSWCLCANNYLTHHKGTCKKCT